MSKLLTTEQQGSPEWLPCKIGLSKILVAAISYLLLMFVCHAQTVTITGNIPYAKDLIKPDGSLDVWTMSKIRQNKVYTVNPIEGEASVMDRDNNSRGDQLGDRSFIPNETKIYEGTLDLTNTTFPANIAVLVDDLATLVIAEIGRAEGVTGPKFSQPPYDVEGTALWNPKSYKEFSTHLPPGRKYHIILIYTNTANLTAKYNGPVDVDGISVYVSSLPIDITVRKESESDTPPDGLCVVKGTSITFDLNGHLPIGSFSLPQESIKWQTRQIKQNGDWTNWLTRGYSSEYTESWELPGIFQLKAILTMPDGSTQEFMYVRKNDSRHADDRLGNVQDIHRVGFPDYFGITDLPWQSELRNEVVKMLGNKDYANSAKVKTKSYGFDIGGKSAMIFHPGSDKCNLFVYHKVNDIRSAPHVALTRGTFGMTSPPLAIDWWNDNTGRTDNKRRVITTVDIPEWSRLADRGFPQPGFIAARPNLDDEPELYHSHCGILDYDGSWISAGFLKVNKYCHILTPAYQPIGLKN